MSITEPPKASATTLPGRRGRTLLRQPLFLIGSGILLAIVASALAAPILSGYGPNDIDLSNLEAAPSAEHPLGTDALGRDVLARLLYGGRISVLVGVAAVLLQVVIGVTIGAIAGYVGGRTDTVLMRFTEIVMCFPFYAIAITLAAIFGASIWNVILIIGILNWTGLARLVRAELLSLREREYVLAARALGVRPWHIIGRHLLRNAYGPILVNATLAVAGGILAEAALSFLGLGVAQPDPSWGNMLTAAQSMRVLSYEWWLWVPPGLAIVLMVLSINFIGEALASTLTPRNSALLRDLRPHRGLPGRFTSASRRKRARS
ncbi:MAG: oligopeptide ABC transporter permease [Mycetocola sp.]